MCISLLVIGLGVFIFSSVMVMAVSGQKPDVINNTQNLLEAGSPILRQFKPKDYNAHLQNWAAVESRSGLIYIGNTSGVLEFDGVSWRLIPVSNGTIVRSLVLEPGSGRIYVGAISELGYLEPDSQGKMHYVSLVSQIPESQRNFADVWQTFSTDKGIVFSSFKRLYRFGTNGVESWDPKNSFHFSFQIGQKIYTRDVGQGLMELGGDTLKLVNGGERFAGEKIYSILPWPESSGKDILIGTRTQGFFIYNGVTFKPWLTEADEAIKNNLLYNGIVLPDGRFIFGTLRGGAYVIDKKGVWLEHLNLNDGLISNTVTALMFDSQNGLWLTLSDGLSRVEINSNLSQFTKANGVDGVVVSIDRFRETLYVGTTEGLFYLNVGPDASFAKHPDIPNLVWGALPFKDKLLVANYQGVYEVTDSTTKLIYSTNSYGLSSLGNKVYIGIRNGIGILKYENETWHNEGNIPGIDVEVRQILPTNDGKAWAGTYAHGILRISFSDNDLKPTIERFGIADGLPSMSSNMPQYFNGSPIFLTQKGIYYFDEAERRFKPKPKFSQLFSDESRHILGLIEDTNRGLWLSTLKSNSNTNEVGLVKKGPTGEFRWLPQSLSGIADSEINLLYQDANGTLWLGGNDGLFRFDPSINKDYSSPFEVRLRKVISGDGRVLFAGGGKPPIINLPFSDNRLRFEFAALSYDGSGVNQYQVRLEGAEEQWSPWSLETFKDYSNLWEGKYQLFLRAKNRYGVTVESKIYDFHILPPWYRSILAYVSYVFILIALTWGMIRWRLGSLQAQKRLLRKEVAERTRQLATLGAVGREITATLDLDAALESLYRNMNNMLDAKIFGIGLYDKSKQEIEFRLAIENGVRYKPYKRQMNDKNQLAVWCIDHIEPVLIGDYRKEYKRYVEKFNPTKRILANGEQAGQPLSMIYAPILLKEKVIGVLGVQSFTANAYQKQHLNLLQTLASYTAIAIDNGRVHADLLTAYKKVEEVSVTDQLTGLKNRRFLNQHFNEDIKKTLRDYENWKVGARVDMPKESDHVFFLLDLDHFKQINDTYGHAAGDNVLVQIKRLLTLVFRNSDFLIRWGGEEFLVITRFTQRSSSTILAERIRTVIEEYEFDIGEERKIKMTSSIGFASFPFIPDKYNALTWEQVINIADRCLYMAKENQRNAWVGVFAGEDIDSDEISSCLAEQQQNLLYSKGMKLITSMKKEYKVI
ncbi:diguanylate cyclase [Aliikangiella sp. IMCC44359]|uniref:diguanylate cyclase n=1 Tax=Aliikangiella sp. IMCC44359 TaxID=3459125 RepID=UPI00403A834B